MSRSPSPKRVKLESSPVAIKLEDLQDAPPQHAYDEDDEDDGERCSICLQGMLDRTVIPTCAHEFCFDCLLIWTGQSRRCPLCSQTIGDFLIHKIRSRYDYQKHFLAPLRTSPAPLLPLSRLPGRPRRRRVREREWGRREPTEQDEADRLDRAISQRRWIYEHGLYAKHVASNAYTRYRPYPTPSQFAGSTELISRTTMFLRRELQVWMNLDVEFLTNFVISIMKAIDIRSESAVKLLSEFLDLDTIYVEGSRHPNAEHFAHEVYSYVRSPYKDLFIYDTVVQYENSPDRHAPHVEEPLRRTRWRESSPRSPKPPLPRASSRSRSPPPKRVPREKAREREPDEHTSGGSSGLHLSETQVPTDKCRDDEEDISIARREDADKSKSPAHIIDAAITRKAEASHDDSRPKKTHRIKHRNLLESVQAHLSSDRTAKRDYPSRLDELRGDDDLETPPTEKQHDTGHVEDPALPGDQAKIVPPLPSEPDGNEVAAGNDRLGRRAQLLQRLLEERSTGGKTASEIDVVEARLRRQTQLRVRLAAEKQASRCS